jgi:hypothetical protein
MIQSRRRNDPPPRPVTLSAAEDLGAFELAELWADRMAWPLDKRTPYDELAEPPTRTGVTWCWGRCPVRSPAPGCMPGLCSPSGT